MSLGPRLRLFAALFAAFALPAALAAQATAPAVTMAATNLGTSTPSSATVTFTFSASTTVSSVAVVTQGNLGLDFQPGTQIAKACVAGTYAANATCTEVVKFTPTAPGVRLGAVNLLDSSANILATAYVSGKALGGQFTLQGALTTVNLYGGPGNVVDAVYDAAGTLFYVGSSGITRVTPAGVVTTCTCPLLNATAVAIDGSGQIFVGSSALNVGGAGAADLYLVNFANGTSTEVLSSYGLNIGDDGINYPTRALVADGAGNLYLGLESNRTIQELIQATKTAVTLESGTGYPWGIAIDSGSNVFYTDYLTYAYKVVSGAAQGVATSVLYPRGITVTPDDNLLLYNYNGVYSANSSTGTANLIFTGLPQYVGELSLDAQGNVLISGYSALYLGLRTAAAVTAPTSTAVNSLSAEQLVTFTNTGSGPAAPGTFVASGPVVLGPSTTCNNVTAIAVGATCIVGIQFKPTQHGISPQTATLTSTGSASSRSLITVTGNVTGDPSKVAFAPALVNVIAGGNAGTISAALQDSNGNTAINTNTQPITLVVSYSNGTSVTYGPVNAVDGVAAFNTSANPLTLSGTYTYTASSPGLPSAVASQSVTGAAVASITVTPASTAVNAGNSDNISITALDRFGNLAAASSNTFAYTSTDTTATLPPAFALNGNMATQPVTFNQGGTFTVTVTDTTTSAVPAAVSPNIVVTGIPLFLITLASDPATGAAANCPDQSSGPTGNNTACTLRDALAAVDAVGSTGLNGAQPIINFASGVNAVVLSNGALTTTHNFRLIGNGPTVTSISGNSTQQIFTQSTGALHCSFLNLTLKAAKSTGTGGAIYQNAANILDFANVVFSGNQAQSGGAIYSPSGTLNITSSSFDSNVATGTSPIISGGAIYLSGQVTSNITNSTFTNNTAPNGGAIDIYGSPVNIQISSSSFTGNKGTSYGGALYMYGATNGFAKMLITNSLFTGNTSARGGAAFINVGGATVIFTGSTFTGNSATTQGGALYMYGSAYVSFFNDTITGNSAVSSSGGAYFMGSATATIFDNTLLGGNTTGSTYNDSNSTPTLRNSLWNAVSASTTTIAPHLSALTSFGPSIGAGTFVTTLQIMLPLPGSPLLGAGSASYISPTLGAGPTTDARGLPRFTTVGSAKSVDIGATQSNYALSFIQQPTNAQVNTAFAPLPTVQVTESGIPFNATPANTTFPGVLTLTAATGTPANPTVTLPSSSAPAPFGATTTFPLPQLNDTLTASILSSTGALLASSTSSAFNIANSTGVTSIGFSTPPPATLNSGANAGTVRVALLSAGATNTTATAQVTLTVTGATTTTYGPIAAVNGIATFNLAGVSLTTGTYTYFASSPYTTDTITASESVASPVFGSFTVSGIAPIVVTGRTQSLVVTALDQSGSVLTTFTGTVTLTTSDAFAVLSPLSYTFTASDNGVHTFLVTLGTAGPQSVTATTGALFITTNTASSGFLSILNSGASITRLFGDGSLFGSYTGTGNIGQAIDAAGDVWSLSGNTLSEFSRTGFNLSGSNFTGGGLNSPVALAVDGAGQVWIANSGNNSVSVFSNSGTALSPATTGYTGRYSKPTALTIDIAGSVWVANSTNNTVTEILGAAAPTPPLAQGVVSGTTGSKP